MVINSLIHQKMTNQRKTVYLVTGDIGGTNSRMALYKLDRKTSHENPIARKTYNNAQELESLSGVYNDRTFLDRILKPFLTYCWSISSAKLEPISDCVDIVACIASAGIVDSNKVRLTNLSNLLIDGNMIQEDVSSPYMARIIRCLVINDFVAQGYGCLTLKPSEVRHLNGPNDANVFSPESTRDLGPKVCVGAGTGLGECYLTQSVHGAGRNHDPYSCFPSEGGHVEFAPRNALEVELFDYLSAKFNSRDRISVERVVSGIGLANVYEFLSVRFPDRIVPSVHQQFLAAGDEQGRVVAENAIQDQGSLCRQAMDIMMSAYGCEVGSAALKWIPTGGLFVSGGLTPKNIHFIAGPETNFMTSYLNKGRASRVLELIPLYAVMTEDLGVRGALKAATVAYQDYMSVHESLNRNPNLAVPLWGVVAAAASFGAILAMALFPQKIGK